MAGRVLNLEGLISPDQLGCEIARMFHTWDMGKAGKKAEWRELYKYIYATDTSTTSNSAQPWKNTTVTPKLTQIRDNLYANYIASMFPRRRWLLWEGNTDTDEEKADAIKAYMSYVIAQPDFKSTVSKLVLDYIDNGNAIAMPEWSDERVEREGKMQAGYVGPVARRLSPFDTVFNPTAPDFRRTPKIISSLISIGELAEYLQRLSHDDEEKETYQKLFDYLMDYRETARSQGGEIKTKDEFYRVDGFTSFRHYLESDYVEVLTFYGDLYDKHAKKFYKNHIIQVVDRHKVIRNAPNPSDLGHPSIVHSGWRPRQDNLWAMGPLDNLVGLQYRLDHIENGKADFFDLTNYPPLKIKGYVEDFEWGPFSKIYVGDEGDVEVLNSGHNPLQANFELQAIEAKMEELAGAPKEAMGIRTPGEKTAFEVQRLENAASRIFQNKIAQFEEEILEPLLNGMLELARRKMDATTIRVIDDEYKTASFLEITADDLQASGRLRPVAARHFAERAERVQTLTNFYASGIGQDEDVKMHWSGIELARAMEELLDLESYKLVEPYIRLTERADGQRIALQHEEDTMMGVQTPGGLSPDDFDSDA